MSKLHYGNIFYSNAIKKDWERVQKVQNRCLRICFLAQRYTSNITLHKEAKVLPVYLKSIYDTLKLMYRLAIKQNRAKSLAKYSGSPIRAAQVWPLPKVPVLSGASDVDGITTWAAKTRCIKFQQKVTGTGSGRNVWVNTHLMKFVCWLKF